jgi:uncharacterized Fe-S cluster-containing radical SAM superfamily protein
MDFVKRMLVNKALKEKAERYNKLAHSLMCSNIEVACAEYIMGREHLDSVSFVTQGMNQEQLKKYTLLLHSVRMDT